MDGKFNENYNSTDDDNDIEYEDRQPDYYASVAYSGGNPFSFKGDVEKRREFWNWYITTAEILINSPDKPVIHIEEKKVIPLKTTKHIERTQSFKDEKNEKLIQEVIQATIDFLKDKNISYDMFRLDSDCITFTNTYSIYLINDGKEEQLILPILEWFDFSPATDLYEVKCNMYNQSPEEGAWLNCSLIAGKKNNYKLYLNYDDKDRLYTQDTSKDSLLYEFEKFPRKIDFTPDWWKNILGKNTEYLK